MPKTLEKMPGDPAPLLGREGDSGDAESDGEERPAAQPLDRPGDDQLVDVLGGAGRDRAGHEDDEAEYEEPPPSVQVRELAEDRHRDGLGEDVGAEDPGVEVEPSEVGDYGRASRGDDGLVEGPEQEPRHQTRYDQDEVPPRNFWVGAMPPLAWLGGAGS